MSKNLTSYQKKQIHDEMGHKTTMLGDYPASIFDYKSKSKICACFMCCNMQVCVLFNGFYDNVFLPLGWKTNSPDSSFPSRFTVSEILVLL